MPRIKREGWKPITITLAPEATTRLRVHAALRDQEMGALVTELILSNMAPVLLADSPKYQETRQGSKSRSRTDEAPCDLPSNVGRRKG